MQGVVEYDMRGVRGPLANSFVILINALFFSMKLIGLTDIYPKDYSGCLLKEKQDTFDFIIVGAGTAGCSLANRLSENDIWSVLLLEAGDYPSPTSEVPNLYPTVLGTEEDWNFNLEKDDHACNSYFASRCTISKGKVLGGTSSINNMLYIRGLTEDYDRLAFESWGSNTTYSIFEKLENFRGPDVFNIKYGIDGPIKLQHANYTGPPKKFLHLAYQNVGLLSMSYRHALGFSDFLTMVYNGERRNMAKNFLTPIKDRPNLYFSKESEVTSVVLAEVLDQRATGVTVKIKGREIQLKAKKEVILTAGAINNAKLLLLSGLGPRKYLTEKKICVRVDLPAVGKNLQFHLTVPIFVAYQSAVSTCNRDYYSETDIIRETYDYVIHRTGCLSHTNINDFITFISTKTTGFTLPNVAIQHSYFKIDDKRLVSWVESMEYHPRIRSNLIKKNKERAIILFNIQLVRPESRGEILLNETHHQGNPRIIPNFLSDEGNLDFETLLSGFDFVTNLTDMNKKETEFLDLDIPNCRNYKFCTMGYVRCYIYNMATPNHDVAGTTPMGADCEDLAVVKENLEVRTMRCLRVADSSVLNSIPVGNTIATDAMIGFKMAEILMEKWESDYRSLFIPEQPNQPV